MLRGPPGGAGGSGWGEDCLGVPAEDTAPATRTLTGKAEDDEYEYEHIKVDIGNNSPQQI